jgi:aminoglycoside 2'-N-acetyltransferase I
MVPRRHAPAGEDGSTNCHDHERLLREDPALTTLWIGTSDELTAEELGELRAVFDAAWREPMSDEDWSHMLPAVHFLLKEAGEIASHAAVVKRELHAGAHRLSTGYLENMATRPELQGRGFGTRVLRAVNEHIAAVYELGALDTSRPTFYERHGWQLWRGPISVRAEGGPVRTPEEEGAVMALLTPTSPPLDLGAPISCEWRPGDVW